MGPDEARVHDLLPVTNGHDQAIIVALDVENHAVATDKTGLPVRFADRRSQIDDP